MSETANFEGSAKWTDYSIRDGNLVTGENPQSLKITVEKLIEAVEASYL
ncbi:hypothetical protein LI012_08580 [Caldibacillus thermoamylovorans]|nr:hypothetical protein [Caldibacillus thermoamylovorans]MCB5935534.1 hypothetical protein [Bacillus sp. DFI.2.34]MCB7076878.1 hypothetical protein [Caldibacillus thermoamylovorans]